MSGSKGKNVRSSPPEEEEETGTMCDELTKEIGNKVKPGKEGRRKGWEEGVF